MTGWTLVTGAAKRLGAEIAIGLAKESYNVVIHYNTSQVEAIQVAEKCRSLGVKAEIIQGDFSSLDKTEQFIKEYLLRFSNTENLVNNVGNYLIKSLLNTSLEEMTDLLQTNLLAPFQLMQKLVPSIKQNQGNILNLGFAGLNANKADSYASAYALTKSSLLFITKTFAKELAPYQVCVNMISPGYIDNAVDLPDLSTLPMGRAVSCYEVVNAILFLLKKENHSITGQNLEISGGIKL